MYLYIGQIISMTKNHVYVHNIMLPTGAKGAFDAELRSEIKVHCTFNIGVGSS